MHLRAVLALVVLSLVVINAAKYSDYEEFEEEEEEEDEEEIEQMLEDLDRKVEREKKNRKIKSKPRKTPKRNPNARPTREPTEEPKAKQQLPADFVPNCKRWFLCWCRYAWKFVESNILSRTLNKSVCFYLQHSFPLQKQKSRLDVCQHSERHPSNSFKFAREMCFVFIFSALSHWSELYCRKGWEDEKES